MVVSNVYLKGSIKFSCNATEHMLHVCTVRLLLHEGGLKLNLKKCQFFSVQIDDPVDIDGPEILELHARNTDAARSLKQPCSETECELFLHFSTV